MIQIFDYDALDYIQETKQCFTSNTIDLLSDNQKAQALKSLELKSLKKSNGGTSNLPVEFEDLISAVSNADFENSEKLIFFLLESYNFLDDELLSCKKIDNSLDEILKESEPILQHRELIVLKSFMQTMKASSRFWFPIELGGIGVGYEHIVKMNKTNKSDRPWYANALISDCCSMGIGMVGVAVAGALGPVGWTALAIAAGEAIASSGIGAAI
ncbi:MAG: hypothetical protein PHW19_08425 [Salinivirgaceae bacterium]|nr:hypothetical protein [Salinivirgaceae bacterium]